MAILAGIDEAGYGPLLGPLVVSASVFRLPDEMADECLWEALAGAVTRRAFRKSPALPLADSKVMRVRTEGLIHLDRGVLGMLRQLGQTPRTFAELLRLMAPGMEGQMGGYPWYAGADLPLPRQADATDLALRANAVAEAMRRRGMSLEAIRAEPVLAGKYNRLVGATRNKSVALFGVTSQLIWEVFSTHAGAEPTRIVADRQGGRIRYLRYLQQMFEGAAIRVIEESDRRSAYLIRDGRRQVEISFLTGAEDRSLPVALASMVSKYVRELFMELLNRWWAGRIEDLKPTAGYYTDGQRFLRDIDRAIAAEGVDKSLLVRSR